jgi:hypothetical protein
VAVTDSVWPPSLWVASVASIARNAAANRALRELVDPVRFPALSPMISAGEFDDDEENPDDFNEVFEFSLGRIIAGIDALVQERAAGR